MGLEEGKKYPTVLYTYGGPVVQVTVYMCVSVCLCVWEIGGWGGWAGMKSWGHIVCVCVYVCFCVCVCVCVGGGGAEVESWGHYLWECATSSLYTCS